MLKDIYRVLILSGFIILFPFSHNSGIFTIFVAYPAFYIADGLHILYAPSVLYRDCQISLYLVSSYAYIRHRKHHLKILVIQAHCEALAVRDPAGAHLVERMKMKILGLLLKRCMRIWRCSGLVEPSSLR